MVEAENRRTFLRRAVRNTAIVGAGVAIGGGVGSAAGRAISDAILPSVVRPDAAAKIHEQAIALVEKQNNKHPLSPRENIEAYLAAAHKLYAEAPHITSDESGEQAFTAAVGSAWGVMLGTAVVMDCNDAEKKNSQIPPAGLAR